MTASPAAFTPSRARVRLRVMVYSAEAARFGFVPVAADAVAVEIVRTPRVT